MTGIYKNAENPKNCYFFNYILGWETLVTYLSNARKRHRRFHFESFLSG